MPKSRLFIETTVWKPSGAIYGRELQVQQNWLPAYGDLRTFPKAQRWITIGNELLESLDPRPAVFDFAGTQRLFESTRGGYQRPADEPFVPEVAGPPPGDPEPPPDPPESIDFDYYYDAVDLNPGVTVGSAYSFGERWYNKGTKGSNFYLENTSANAGIKGQINGISSISVDQSVTAGANVVWKFKRISGGGRIEEPISLSTKSFVAGVVMYVSGPVGINWDMLGLPTQNDRYHYDAPIGVQPHFRLDPDPSLEVFASANGWRDRLLICVFGRNGTAPQYAHNVWFHRDGQTPVRYSNVMHDTLARPIGLGGLGWHTDSGSTQVNVQWGSIVIDELSDQSQAANLTRRDEVMAFLKTKYGATG